MIYDPHLYLTHHGLHVLTKIEIKGERFGDLGITPQDYVDEPKPLEADDPKTGALGDQNQVKLQLA